MRGALFLNYRVLEVRDSEEKFMVFDPTPDRPSPLLHVREPTEARANRAEVTKYILAGMVTIAVAFFGFLGNRVANTIDRTDTAVQELREAVAVFRSYTNTVQSTLLDHESRLREARDTLVQHGVRLTDDELKIIALDQRTAAITSTPRR